MFALLSTEHVLGLICIQTGLLIKLKRQVESDIAVSQLLLIRNVLNFGGKTNCQIYCANHEIHLLLTEPV